MGLRMSVLIMLRKRLRLFSRSSILKKRNAAIMSNKRSLRFALDQTQLLHPPSRRCLSLELNNEAMRVAIPVESM